MDKIVTDIMIVGAGLVGMATAICLGRLGYQVVLIDQKMPNAEISSNLDSRIYAISPSTMQWLKTLGVWQLVDAKRINPINAMKIFGDADVGGRVSVLNLLASEVNAQNLGFIVEGQQLAYALWQVLQTMDVKVITNVVCESLETTAQKASLSLVNLDSANQQQIEAQLVVAADGGDSWVRAQTNIAVQAKSYQHHAIVANFSSEMPHQDVAVQWFGGGKSDNFGSNSVLAFLPLPDNQISIVWSLATEKAQALLHLSDADFIQQLTEQCGGALGDLQLVSQRISFNLSKKTAMRLIDDSLVLVGDAAHQIHPMAGQGVNLGFRDVMALEQALAKSKLASRAIDQRALREYERARSADISRMMALTDGLHRLFGNQNSVVKTLRNWGLSSINQQSFVKKLLIKQVVN